MTYLSYRELLEILSEFTEEELNMSVTLFDAAEDEFYTVQTVVYAGEEYSDVVESEQPVLVF